MILHKKHLVAAVSLAISLCFGPPAELLAAEHVRLNAENWSEYAPAGKEADCIYGDYVLRNDKIVVVVADAIKGRNANMTVRGVRGAVIDLSVLGDGPKAAPDVREVEGVAGAWATNDQLSAFYPHGKQFAWILADSPPNASDSEAMLRLVGEAINNQGSSSALRAELVYRLADGEPYLEVISTITNVGDADVTLALEDRARTDGEFAKGYDPPLGMAWMYDSFWGQAYGLMAAGNEFTLNEMDSDNLIFRYSRQDGGATSLAAGESTTLTRRIFPGAHHANVKAIAQNLVGAQSSVVKCVVSTDAGPIAHAEVSINDADGTLVASGRTDVNGRFDAALPPGAYIGAAKSPAHARADFPIETQPGQDSSLQVDLLSHGYVAAKIVDERGGPIPCKVQFIGRDGTPNPNFGPDSAVFGVRNVYYTPTGAFRIALVPGAYDVVISRGNEYDAVQTQIEVATGEAAPLEAVLVRSVDTSGWVSSDFHSHASPSGDNTASQRGRVLNLVAEHIEFIPCTEHNRVSTYDRQLAYLGLTDEVATCTGMELTGSPLPLNHQNAFPLIHKPRTQDGGGPTTTVNPVEQIERLAMWDEGSDKLVQTNHPNIVQMLGDRDQDGKADGGFERMFHVMDVIEVHPPGNIFSKPDALPANARERGNVIFNWMQLLNLGYRVPGVVNTDAHWNFHGSGWLRNYIRSTTDEPSKASIADLVDAAEQGRMVMTNGPFMEVTAFSRADAFEIAGPGDDLSAPEGKLRLHVRVQCANWLKVNRVQVFLNGRPVEALNFTAREDRELFDDGPVVFDHSTEISLDGDTHIIVAAAGEGEKLGVVMGPSAGGAMPVAVSNPIFVDVDGDGFQSNGDMLDLPLPIEVSTGAAAQ